MSFHTIGGLIACPPQPLRDLQWPVLLLHCWQLIIGPKKHSIPTFPLIAGSCISRAQMQRYIWHSLVFSDKGIGRKVTIKGVVNSGWVREAQISKRFPSVEPLCSYKIGENDLHREWQTTWKDLTSLRCSHHADIEHTWLAPKVHSWLLEVSQGQHWGCVSCEHSWNPDSLQTPCPFCLLTSPL